MTNDLESSSGMPKTFEDAIRTCLGQMRRWKLPPNWTVQDWNSELRSVAVLAALKAAQDYDPAFKIPLGAFVHVRVSHRTLARYRQEWRFGTKCQAPTSGQNEDDDDAPNGQSSHCAAPNTNDAADAVREALQLLSEPCRRLVELFFWQEETQAEVGKALGVSQCAISNRKAAVLRCLRRSLSSRSPCQPCRSEICWRNSKKMKDKVIKHALSCNI